MLFVRKPNPSGDFIADVDISLYDTARSALREIPLEEWSFMVFNTIDPSSRGEQGDNSDLCRELSEKVNEGSTIKVSETIIANCADPQSASTGILDPLLDYLEGHITALDEGYLSACLDKHERLHRTINAELEKARTALGKAESDDVEFVALFRELWRNLNRGLTALLRRFEGIREAENSQYRQDFQKSVAAIIKECRDSTNSIIPTLEHIETTIDTENSAQSAYNVYLDQTRAHLSQKFLKLDEGLTHSFDMMKAQVSEVLIEKGRMGGLTDSRGPKFLEEIKNQLEDIKEHTKELKEGFEILSDFTLSYRGFAPAPHSQAF